MLRDSYDVRTDLSTRSDDKMDYDYVHLSSHSGLRRNNEITTKSQALSNTNQTFVPNGLACVTTESCKELAKCTTRNLDLLCISHYLRLENTTYDLYWQLSLNTRSVLTSNFNYLRHSDTTDILLSTSMSALRRTASLYADTD